MSQWLLRDPSILECCISDTEFCFCRISDSVSLRRRSHRYLFFVHIFLAPSLLVLNVCLKRYRTDPYIPTNYVVFYFLFRLSECPRIQHIHRGQFVFIEDAGDSLVSQASMSTVKLERESRNQSCARYCCRLSMATTFCTRQSEAHS